MNRKEFARRLDTYVPDDCSELVTDWLYQGNAILTVSKSRESKLGDYRPPFKNKGHRISVNHDLNRFAFLITLVHEIAHMHTWMRHKSNVKPHGTEWKGEFKQLMHPFLINDTFPIDIKHALDDYMRNPAASSCVHAPLLKVLKKYDNRKDIFLLEDLPMNTLFVLSKRAFVKGEKLRTRYRCRELKSNQIYLINGLAEVKPIQR